MQTTVLITIALLARFASSFPFFGFSSLSPFSPKSDHQTPAEEKSWFKKKMKKDLPMPEYVLNPNFGFRSYHQIRYEPMTVPFAIEGNPELPPLELSVPDSAYPQDLKLCEDGTAYRQTVAKKSSNSRSGSGGDGVFSYFSGMFTNFLSYFGHEPSTSSFSPAPPTPPAPVIAAPPPPSLPLPPRTQPYSQFGSRQTSYGF